MIINKKITIISLIAIFALLTVFSFIKYNISVTKPDYNVNFEKGWSFGEYNYDNITVYFANPHKAQIFNLDSEVNNNITFRQYLSEISDNSIDNLNKYGNIENIKINNIDFKKQNLILTDKNVEAINYFTLKDGHLYSIIFEFEEQSAGDLMQKFKDESIKIINTFEF